MIMIVFKSLWFKLKFIFFPFGLFFTETKMHFPSQIPQISFSKRN